MGRVSRDLGAGACLLGLAAVATWQSAGLELGTLRQMGPGMFPRVLAVLVGVCGGALGLRSWLQPESAEPARASPQLAAEPAVEPAVGRKQAWRAPLCLLL
ncbi:MAG: hypothetical protein RL033_2691, partial [Pseudomonadota bacterium]